MNFFHVPQILMLDRINRWYYLFGTTVDASQLSGALD